MPVFIRNVHSRQSMTEFSQQHTAPPLCAVQPKALCSRTDVNSMQGAHMDGAVFDKAALGALQSCFSLNIKGSAILPTLHI